MSGDWVDFSRVKQAVSLAAVLQDYGVDWLKPSGAWDHLRGRCPIHGKGGEDAFHASLRKNAFQCFYCQKKGNVLDFVVEMEKCSLRQAALQLQQRFSIHPVNVGLPAVSRDQVERKGELVPKEKDLNRPLSFTLPGVDQAHPYLQQRRIETATADAFGVGYFGGRGLLSGRIVIPLHDEWGRLVAYSGRAIDRTLPKYKLPPRFRKSLVLFNLHRAKTSRRDAAIVVEGFFDCMMVYQAGWDCVVALMGTSLSVQQEQLLRNSFERIVLMLDGDEAGRKGSTDIAARLNGKCSLHVCQLPGGQQPDQLVSEQIQKILERYTCPW